MTTPRRFRAGQPCDYGGCNVPEGECSNACMSKAQPQDPEDLPIDFAGDEPIPTPARIAIIILLAVIGFALVVPL